MVFRRENSYLSGKEIGQAIPNVQINGPKDIELKLGLIYIMHESKFMIYYSVGSF